MLLHVLPLSYIHAEPGIRWRRARKESLVLATYMAIMMSRLPIDCCMPQTTVVSIKVAVFTYNEF